MYLAAMGPWYFWIIAAAAFVANQVGSVSTNVWIRQWANSYQTSRTDSKRATVDAFHHPASFAANALLGTALLRMPQTGDAASSVTISLAAADVNVAYYLGV